MKHQDSYLEHISAEIEELEKKLSEATAARDHYLRYAPNSNFKKSPDTNLKTDQETANRNNVYNRKSLRSDGRSRDLFEYFYRAEQGATLQAAAKNVGYDLKEVKQFYYRYKKDDLLKLNGDKVLITDKGRALVDESQPYTGTKKWEDMF
ncbi:MAG: hypothetical protein WC464_05975 [Bdellovibrionales bacterium]